MFAFTSANAYNWLFNVQFCEGTTVVNRADWQKIAEEKLLAADALLLASPSQSASAYYLAGYAIECGLKSCILARIAGFPELIFEDKMYSKNCWTHNVEDLVELAGLKPDLASAIVAAPALATNWKTVKEWSENARYQMKSHPEAQALYRAINDPVSGVMQWIRARW